MNTYKKFFIKTIILILLTSFLVSLIFVSAGYYFIGTKKIEYKGAANTHGWIVKKTKIAKELNSKGSKLVLYGGSNILFGVNAAQIEKETGIQTLNYGTHAGFADYIFQNAKNVLKPNDTVFLPLEFSYYSSKMEMTPLTSTAIEYIISYDNNYYRKLSYFNKLKVLLYLTKLNIKKDIMHKNDTVIDYLNDRGDFIYNQGQKSEFSDTAKQLNISTNKLPNNYKKWELYKFIKWCKGNNIKVYAFMPNAYHDPNLTAKEKTSFDEIKKFYKLCGVEFIGKAEDGFFELKYFHDSVYHLNQEGQKIRTRYFIEKIRSLNNLNKIRASL